MAYIDTMVTLGVFVIWWWLLGAVHGKPVETSPKFGLVIKIPADFIQAVPLDDGGKPQLRDSGGGGAFGEDGSPAARGFPSLFLSDADTIFGPTFSSQMVNKRVRSKSSYQNSNMDAPKESACEAYCALKKDKHS